MVSGKILSLSHISKIQSRVWNRPVLPVVVTPWCNGAIIGGIKTYMTTSAALCTDYKMLKSQKLLSSVHLLNLPSIFKIAS